MSASSAPLTNWAGTYAYAFDRIEQPSSREELQELVAGADSLTVVGSRHSFSGITDGVRAVSVAGLPVAFEVSADRRTIGVNAGISYGALAELLHAEGLALHNLASLPHISVGGAIATATHGSGVGNGNLATAVEGLEFVLADGSVREVHRGDDRFEGLVVHLGALGVVTRVWLDVEPTYDALQRVYENVPWSTVMENFDELMRAAYSVSVFTDRSQETTQVWLKQRASGAELPAELFGHPTAKTHLHPLPGFDSVNCTPQLGEVGRWSDRLPHFRMEFTPSNGEEIQSEFHVPAEHAVEMIAALLPLREQLASVLQDWELRAIAADELWLSPQYQRPSVAVHMTWDPDVEGVAAAVKLVEEAIAPFAPRPHWGKVFSVGDEPTAARYPHYADFLALREELDPTGTFVNPWLRANVLGAPT